MNEKYTLADLVPHSGKMSLLDQVIDITDNGLKAVVQVTDKSMFVEPQGVSSIIGIEYMAQAIAAYSGSQERLKNEKPKLGFLLGARNYSASVGYFPLGTRLIVEVQLEMKADNGLNVFYGTLRSDTIEASARLNVFQPDNAEVFLKGML